MASCCVAHVTVSPHQGTKADHAALLFAFMTKVFDRKFSLLFNWPHPYHQKGSLGEWDASLTLSHNGG